MDKNIENIRDKTRERTTREGGAVVARPRREPPPAAEKKSDTERMRRHSRENKTRPENFRMGIVALGADRGPGMAQEALSGKMAV